MESALLCRKAKQKVPKMFPFVKMARSHGGVSIHLKLLAVTGRILNYARRPNELFINLPHLPALMKLNLQTIINHYYIFLFIYLFHKL